MYLAAFLGRTKAIWPGAVVGAGGGLFVYSALHTSLIPSVLGFGLLGLILDFLLSKNYQTRKKLGLPTTFYSSWGGFKGGSGGGFGGFGGGRSGGGGASGSW